MNRPLLRASVAMIALVGATTTSLTATVAAPSGAAAELARRCSYLPLALTGEDRDRFPQIEAYIGLAAACQGLGRGERAVEYGQRALTAAGRTGFRILETARAALAAIGSRGVR